MESHDLKIWPQYFDAVKAGKKTFEIRSIKDRIFEVGDCVLLREYVYESKEYTGRSLAFRIGYVLPVDHERVVFSLLPI